MEVVTSFGNECEEQTLAVAVIFSLLLSRAQGSGRQPPAVYWHIELGRTLAMLLTAGMTLEPIRKHQDVLFEQIVRGLILPPSHC